MRGDGREADGDLEEEEEDGAKDGEVSQARKMSPRKDRLIDSRPWRAACVCMMAEKSASAPFN